VAAKKKQGNFFGFELTDRGAFVRDDWCVWNIEQLRFYYT
jgi:hypothetical protein